VSHQLPPPRHRNDGFLSWGLSASQSLYDDSAVASVGLTRTLFAVCPWSHQCRSIRTGPALRYPRRRPSRNESTLREILSQAWAPLQSFTNAPPWPASSPAHTGENTVHPFRGSFPSSVLPAARSHLPPVSLHLTGYTLRPRGFAPPRRVAPLTTCRACFIPVPLMGFAPSRPCSPRNAVRSFERRDPRAIGSGAERRIAAPGLCSSRGSRTRAAGFGRDRSRLPPWGCAPPRFLAHLARRESRFERTA